MNSRELYAIGVVLEHESGAIVVVEKRPRKTGRVERGFETYEDVLTVAYVERLNGSMTEMLARVARLLDCEPFYRDSVTYAEASSLGRTLTRLLAQRGALVGSVSIAGDVESCDPKTGEWSVAPNILQARIRLALESGRLVAVNELTEGEPLLRDLENLAGLPETGPARELANAAAIAVWVGDRHATNGPWASSKAPPIGSEAAKYFDERDAVRELAEEEHNASSRGGRLRSMLPRRGRTVNR